MRSPENRLVEPPAPSRSMPVTVARTSQNWSVGASASSTATLPVVGADDGVEPLPEPPPPPQPPRTRPAATAAAKHAGRLRSGRKWNARMSRLLAGRGGFHSAPKPAGGDGGSVF